MQNSTLYNSEVSKKMEGNESERNLNEIRRDPRRMVTSRSI